jgi:hypothetical protein
MLISQILLDQFTQILLHVKENLVGHISALEFLVLENIVMESVIQKTLKSPNLYFWILLRLIE